MAYPSLTKTEFNELSNLFLDILNRTIDNRLLPKDDLNEIVDWIDYIQSMNIISVGLWANLNNLTESIYNSNTIRNFVFSLSFELYAMGNVLEKDERSNFDLLLAGNLANGLMITDTSNFLGDKDNYRSLLSTLPDVSIVNYYKETSINKEESLPHILNSNRHLIIVILIMLFVRDTDSED